MSVSVCLCCDETFAAYAAASIYSIVKSAEPETEYNFFIGFSDLSDTAKQILTRAAGTHTIEFVKIDKTEFDNYNCTVQWITQAAAYRLIVPLLIRKDIERLIYIDCDTLVYEDLTDMYNYDMKGKTLGVVLDVCWSQHTWKANTAKYFNSGVLLFDCKRWRDNEYFVKVREALNHKNNSLPDQDALNRVMHKDSIYLPLRYNLQLRADDKHYYTNIDRLEYNDSKEHPVIAHFIGRVKPWHVDYHTHKFRQDLLKLVRELELDKSKFNIQRDYQITAQPIKKVKLPDVIEIDRRGYAYDYETKKRID